MDKRLPIFREADGQRRYLAAYEAVFRSWTVPYESLDVKTRYGSTHVNVSGARNGRPLVLLHGAGLSSAAWYGSIAGLSEKHCVYAVDTIGDAGKSITDVLPENRRQYAEWLEEVFDKLSLGRVYLLGHSYGGWLTLNMALACAERLRAIVLLAPAASIYPMSFIANLGLRLAPFRPIRLRARTTFRLIAPKGTRFNEGFLHLMEMVTRYCKPAMMFPTVYTDAELQQIRLPALLLIGSKERIYNPSKALRRAKGLIPNLTAEIVPGFGHTLPMEQPEVINSRVLDFLRGV